LLRLTKPRERLMPDFDFNLTVNPKPEGNFRPRVDVSVRIPANRFPHNPQIKGIHLIMPCHNLPQFSEETNSSFGSFYANYVRNFLLRRRAIGMFPNNNVILPEPVYVGNGQMRKGTRNNLDPFENNMIESIRVTCIKSFLLYFGIIVGLLFLGSFIKVFAVLGMLGIFSAMPLAMLSGFDFFPFRLTYYRFTLVPEGYPDSIDDINLSFYLPCRDGDKPDYSDFIKEFKKIPQILEKQLSSGSRSGSTEEVTIKYDKASRFDNESGGATRQNP
jgi:hypothetical protein